MRSLRTSHCEVQDEDMAEAAQLTTIYRKRDENTSRRQAGKKTPHQRHGRHRLVDVYSHRVTIVSVDTVGDNGQFSLREKVREKTH